MFKIFSKRWIITTLLVSSAVLVMIRLGNWQLDRLNQRRTLNTRIESQVDSDVLELTEVGKSLNLYNMEFRTVRVQGVYDFDQQIGLRNKAANNRLGYHLVTPLVFGVNGEAILVNRGWIPVEDNDILKWREYDEPGKVEVIGWIRRSQTEEGLGLTLDPSFEPGQVKADQWNMLNIERLSDQISLELLDVYIQQSPSEDWQSLPIRAELDLEITEGPHLGYAIQWFLFSIMLGVGYPIYVRNQYLSSKISGGEGIPTRR